MADDGKKLCVVHCRAVSVRQHDERASCAERVWHTCLLRSLDGCMLDSEEFAAVYRRCIDFRRQSRASCGFTESFFLLPETSQPDSTPKDKNGIRKNKKENAARRCGDSRCAPGTGVVDI